RTNVHQRHAHRQTFRPKRSPRHPTPNALALDRPDERRRPQERLRLPTKYSPDQKPGRRLPTPDRAADEQVINPLRWPSALRQTCRGLLARFFFQFEGEPPSSKSNRYCTEG